MNAFNVEETLTGCEIFKGLQPGEIKLIADLCECKCYEAGEVVYQQGDFGEHLYVIKDGQVVLQRSMNIGPRKSKIMIAVIGRGRVFGCWSTLLGEPHIMMLTTFCQTPVNLILLNGQNLRHLMKENTNIGFNVMERLCFLLRERVQAAYGAMERI